MPLVTALIPVYNRAWCVRRALKSALAQSWRPLEVIAIDDGSTDATPAVLHSIAPPPGVDYRVIRREANGGVSAARNAGLSEARGDYIALLDSDDLWRPKKTQHQMEALLKERGWINQTGETWVRNGIRVNPPERLRKRAGDLFAPSLDHCAVSPSAVIFHRSLPEKVGGPFREDYPACEDYEFWLRVTARYSVGLVQEPLLVKFGGHDDQLSRTVPALDRFRIQAMVERLESGSLSPGQAAEARRVLREKGRIYLEGCRKRNREAEARRVHALLERVG